MLLGLCPLQILFVLTESFGANWSNLGLNQFSMCHAKRFLRAASEFQLDGWYKPWKYFLTHIVK